MILSTATGSANFLSEGPPPHLCVGQNERILILYSINCIIFFVLMFSVNSLSHVVVCEHWNKSYRLGHHWVAFFFFLDDLKVPCDPGCTKAQSLPEGQRSSKVRWMTSSRVKPATPFRSGPEASWVAGKAGPASFMTLWSRKELSEISTDNRKRVTRKARQDFNLRGIGIRDCWWVR